MTRTDLQALALGAEWACTCGIGGHGADQLMAHCREHQEIETAVRAQHVDIASDFPLQIVVNRG